MPELSLLEKMRERNRRRESEDNTTKSLEKCKPPELDQDYCDKQIQSVIEYLNAQDISLMDFPEEIRHRAFLIEQDLTAAANDGDKVKFDTCLTRWRTCFH